MFTRVYEGTLVNSLELDTSLKERLVYNLNFLNICLVYWHD